MVKRVKDPNAPKRSKNAYMFFTDATRSTLEGSVGEKAKEMGKMWKALSDDEKAPYNKMAEKSKKESNDAKEKYDKSSRKKRWTDEQKAKKEADVDDDSEDKPKKKAKKVKDPNAPKRGKNAYMFFTDVTRSTLEGSVSEKAKEMGKMWKELSDDEKGPFVKKAEKDKKRYTEAMEKYKA